MKLGRDTKHLIGMGVLRSALLVGFIGWVPRLHDAVGDVGVGVVAFVWILTVPVGLSMLLEWAFDSRLPGVRP